MRMGTGMGMVDRKWERNGNSSLEEIPVSRVIDLCLALFQRATADAVESRWFASLPHTLCDCLLIYKYCVI